MLHKNLMKPLMIALVVLLSIQYSYAQTMMQMPSQAYTYSNQVRGYWFTAPVDFTIVGLRVPSQAGSGTQSIQVIKIHDNPPVVYNTTSTNFTTLYYTNSGTNGQILTVSIPITSGDRIAILGYAGTTNSYGDPTSVTSQIDGHTVTLKRTGYQGNINSSQAPNYWTQTSGYISRVEMYYETCQTKITSQPQPQTICETQNTQFGITATDVVDYQWQVDEGSGFINVVNAGSYSGAKTKTLDISNAPYSLDGNLYRCIAHKGSCLDTSDEVTLTVNGLVKLNDLPGHDTTCVHSVKDLVLKGTGSITNYKWQIYNSVTKGFIDVPSTPPYIHMGNVLRISDVPDTLKGAQFRVVVNGICNTSVTNAMRLEVNLLPKVAIPPKDVNAQQGANVSFEVQANVPKARYQWQVAGPDTFVNINEGGIYQGTKTNKLHVKGVSRIQNKFKFRCVVNTMEACNAPGDTSNFGVLYVEPAASVYSINGDNGLTIYPNPTNSELFIKSVRHTDGVSYMVIDKTGRTLMVGSLNASATSTSIDVSRLPADIYILKVVGKEQQLISTMKFTKM